MRPYANKSIHRSSDYPARDGGMGLSLQIDVTHLAAYYQYDPQCERYCETNDWPRLHPNRYLPQPPQTEQAYFDWMQSFQFPQDLRRTAERAAGPLAESLEHMSKRVIERDLASGRLDRHKLADVGKAAAVGQYSDERVRPYRRTEYRDAYTPTVAIVASVETSATIFNEGYCPQLITLTLSVLWACESVGIEARAATVQGRTSVNGPWKSLDYLPVGYSEVVQGFMLTSENVIPARDYGFFLNDDLWMHMKWNVKGSRYDYATVICAMDREPVGYGLLHQFGTHSGGHAVHWARQALGADIVIAIGKIEDSKDAEVALDYDFSVQQAIQMIADKAAKL